jgi:hypothetical protein
LITFMHPIAAMVWPYLRRLGRAGERLLAVRRVCVLTLLGLYMQEVVGLINSREYEDLGQTQGQARLDYVRRWPNSKSTQSQHPCSS